MYNYAHRIFSLSTEMFEAIQDIQGLKSGNLTLGASTTPGEYLLPVAIGKFRQQHPGIQVELKISNTRSIVNHILQRELGPGNGRECTRRQPWRPGGLRICHG